MFGVERAKGESAPPLHRRWEKAGRGGQSSHFWLTSPKQANLTNSPTAARSGSLAAASPGLGAGGRELHVQVVIAGQADALHMSRHLYSIDDKRK